MCLPALIPAGMTIAEALTAATAAVSAAGAAASFVGQQSQARAAESAAEREAGMRLTDGARMQQQEYQQAASQVNAYQDQAMKEHATVAALIGEYGGGVTGQRREAAMGLQYGQDLATLNDTTVKRSAELGVAQAADLYQINARAAATPRPSWGELGLSLAGSYLTFKGRESAIKDPYGYIAQRERRQQEVYQTLPYLKSNRSLGD